MASITTWNRIKPRLDGNHLEKGLEARVHDPLWMMTRQWQFGEFIGEDTGSPIDVLVSSRSSKIDQYQSHKEESNWSGYNAASVPLERLVEEEGGPMSIREAADAGMYLLDLVRDHPALQAALISTYAFQPVGDELLDGMAPSEQNFVVRLENRVIDGRRVHSSVNPLLANSQDLSGVTIIADLSGADNQLLGPLILRWINWFNQRYPYVDEPNAGSAWDPHRMEYNFKIRSSSVAMEFSAEGYTGKHLDWYAFRGNGKVFQADPGLVTNVDDIPNPWVDRVELDNKEKAQLDQTQRLLPTPLLLPGQPASRWWQFEDRRIGFGNLDATAADLSTLLIVEYALAYSDDWYIVPIDQAIGTWYETANLQVTDTFGETIPIKPARSQQQKSPWTMFTLSGVEDVPEREFLFLPPSLPPSRLESKSHETILFRRDEMANLAWAIEQRVQQTTGRSIDRQELINHKKGPHLGPDRNAPTPNIEVELNWKLGTPPPEAWYPLIAQQHLGVQRLLLTRMLKANGELQEDPLGVLLQELDGLTDSYIYAEEIEQSGGFALKRTTQVARWIGGSRHIWSGRRKIEGGADASSGLVFDEVSPPK